MNSLDAIIAMLILMAGLALLLGGLAEQSSSLQRGNKSIRAKLGAFECMSVIDEIYASSVDVYENEIACFVTDGKVKVKANGFEKIVSVIPEIKNEHFLEVGTIDHYQ